MEGTFRHRQVALALAILFGVCMLGVVYRSMTGAMVTPSITVIRGGVSWNTNNPDEILSIEEPIDVEEEDERPMSLVASSNELNEPMESDDAVNLTAPHELEGEASETDQIVGTNSTLEPARCSPNGYIYDLATRFRKYHHINGPRLRDTFADDGYLYGIVNTRYLSGKNAQWPDKGVWKCHFITEKGWVIVYSFSEGRDAHKHIYIVKCKLPSPELRMVTIVGTMVLGREEHRVEFKDAPFCVLPPAPKEPQLVMMCTMTIAKSLAGRQLDYWMSWHTRLGFTKAIIYANEEPFKIRQLVNASPFRDTLEVVDYNYQHYSLEFLDYMDQQATQLSCMYRNRRRFKWIFMNDVDEFFFPKTANSFTEFLQQLTPAQANSPGILLCNMWHQAANEQDQARFEISHDPRLLTRSSNRCTARGKNFVQPEKIQYYSVHVITSGQQGIRAPAKLAYLVHQSWKPWEGERLIPNSAFADKARSVFAGMDEWDFPNGTQLQKQYRIDNQSSGNE